MLHKKLLAVLVVVVVLLLLAVADTAQGAEKRQTLDLNSATVSELQQLPGIGPKRAQDILRSRSIRPFRRTSDLLHIHGIGRKTYRKLRPFVRVDPPKPAPSTRRPVKPKAAEPKVVEVKTGEPGPSKPEAD